MYIIIYNIYIYIYIHVYIYIYIYIYVQYIYNVYMRQNLLNESNY